MKLWNSPSPPTAGAALAVAADAVAGAATGSSSKSNKLISLGFSTSFSLATGFGGAWAVDLEIEVVRLGGWSSKSSAPSYSSNCDCCAEVSRNPRDEDLKSSPPPYLPALDPEPTESLPKPPYRLPVELIKLIPPSLPTPWYLFLLARALRRSVRILSTSPKRRAISDARLRTEGPSISDRRLPKIRMERTVDSLVFTLLVNVMKTSKHLNSRDVRPGIVNNTLRSVLHEEFKQRQGLLT